MTWNTVASIPAQKLQTSVIRVLPDQMSLWLMATGTVTNKGKTTVAGGQICIILLDAAGKPVGWMEDQTTLAGLAPNESRDFKTSYPWPDAAVASRVAAYRVFPVDLSP